LRDIFLDLIPSFPAAKIQKKNNYRFKMVTAPSGPPLSMKLDISTATKPLMILIPHAFTIGLVVITSLFAKNGRWLDVLLLGIVQLANIVIMHLLTKEKQWQTRIAELEARSKQDYKEYQNKLQDMKKQYQNDIDKIQKEAENKLKHGYKAELTAEETTNGLEEMKDMEQRLEVQRQQLEQEKQDFLLEHLEKEKALEKKVEALETALLHW
jgi:hypothetical protein